MKGLPERAESLLSKGCALNYCALPQLLSCHLEQRLALSEHQKCLGRHTRSALEYSWLQGGRPARGCWHDAGCVNVAFIIHLAKLSEELLTF